MQIILAKKEKINLRNYILKDGLDTPIYDTKKAANFINDYFTNVGPKLAQRFASQWEFTGTMFNETLIDFSVLENEIALLLPPPPVSLLLYSSITHL